MINLKKHYCLHASFIVGLKLSKVPAVIVFLVKEDVIVNILKMF